MKKITYICDICHKTIDVSISNIVGFEFATGKNGDILITKHYTNTERHLCKKCWFLLKDMVTMDIGW